MHTSLTRRRRLAVPAVVGLALISLLGPLTACDTQSGLFAPPPVPTGQAARLRCEEDGRELSMSTKAPVALAVSGRANSPAPALSDALKQAIRDVVKTVDVGQTGPVITVIGVEGKPSVAFSSSYTATIPAPEIDSERTNFVDGIDQSVMTVKAKTEEVDDLTALDMAARAAKDGGLGAVALVDSGLQTVAPLDFRQAGMLDAAAGEVVEYLKRNAALPDLTGLTVILDGIGDVAPPQPTLGEGQRKHLVDLYTQIAKAGGAACVAVIQTTPAQKVVSGAPSVGIVPVPPPSQFTIDSGPTVLHDDSVVGFLADTAEFRDAAAAAMALRPLAEWSKAHAHGVLHLTGTTARVGDRKGQEDLSTSRAEQVRHTLESLGADGNRIKVSGLGSYFDGYVPDLAPDGGLLPLPAQQNRKVIVTASNG